LVVPRRRERLPAGPQLHPDPGPESSPAHHIFGIPDDTLISTPPLRRFRTINHLVTPLRNPNQISKTSGDTPGGVLSPNRVDTPKRGGICRAFTLQ